MKYEANEKYKKRHSERKEGNHGWMEGILRGTIKCEV